MNIGVDVGGMSIKAGIVDNSGKIIYKETIPTGAKREMHEIVNDMGLLIDNLIKKSGVFKDRISSVGFGIPGACNPSQGKVIRCSNINLAGAPVVSEVHKYINVPVFLNNDANVAAFAEYSSIGRQMECFIAVTLGTGIGGGIIINGKIYSGFNGVAGELGHITINENGEKCGCGRYGCWESYASVTALIRQTKAAMESDKKSLMHEIALVSGDINGKTAFDAAKQGDKTALKVVETYINHVSAGITNIINIFQPEMIVIGGAICKEGDYLLNPIIEYCRKESYGANIAEMAEIKIASLGNDAGIIGASMLGKSNGVV